MKVAAQIELFKRMPAKALRAIVSSMVKNLEQQKHEIQGLLRRRQYFNKKFEEIENTDEIGLLQSIQTLKWEVAELQRVQNEQSRHLEQSVSIDNPELERLKISKNIQGLERKLLEDIARDKTREEDIQNKKRRLEELDEQIAEFQEGQIQSPANALQKKVKSESGLPKIKKESLEEHKERLGAERLRTQLDNLRMELQLFQLRECNLNKLLRELVHKSKAAEDCKMLLSLVIES